MRPIAAGLAAACALAAQAQAPRDDPWELRLEASRESLDKGHADWREELAQLAWRPQAGRSIFGGYRRTERFGAADREGFAGAYLPVPGLTAVLRLEGTASTTHRVLPRRSWLAEAIQPLGEGWVASGGGRRLRYAAGEATWAWVGIERYAGPYRFGYVAQVARPGGGGGWSPAHRLSASWYRGELTFVTLTAARGREVESVLGAGLLQTDVRAASLAAGLELAPRWGLLLELGWTRQGELYTRRAARIGTRLHF